MACVNVRDCIYSSTEDGFCLCAGPIITNPPLPQIFIRGLASRETACVLLLLLVALRPALSASVSPLPKPVNMAVAQLKIAHSTNTCTFIHTLFVPFCFFLSFPSSPLCLYSLSYSMSVFLSHMLKTTYT